VHYGKAQNTKVVDSSCVFFHRHALGFPKVKSSTEAHFVLHDTLPYRQKDRVSGSHRILLVEDDAISMEILAMMLDGDGHEVFQAIDGTAALDMLSGVSAQSAPDVLLVDMQMPGISGYELAERIQAMRRPKPRLLAMSATEVSNWRLQGFDGFLLKPLELQDLRRALGSESASMKHRPSHKQTGQRAGKALMLEPASNHEEHINQAVLSKLAKAMPPQALHELYQACIADTRTRIMDLQGTVLSGQTDEVRRSAHQVKGAASMIGAARIAELATAIELGSCKEDDTVRLLSDLLEACKDLEGILLAGKLQISK
jgi:CheY-like chemotaxis protein